MNQFIFRFNSEDDFKTSNVLFDTNIAAKDQYTYTFYRKPMRLYQFPEMFSHAGLDLFYISLMVFFADRKIKRKLSDDAWTRQFKIYAPVLEVDKWNENKDLLERMISFLSGDKWTFEFRKRGLTSIEKKIEKGIKRIKKKIVIDKFCMLSGGLDSFIGAIDLLKTNKNVAFVGHYGGGKGVKPFQEIINKQLIDTYQLDNKLFFNFHAKPLRGVEESTRTRSFMFFSHAIVLASGMNKEIELIIPENGLISLNIPLTNTRLGSSSTRTTHPYYMDLLQQLIANIGLKISLCNPYQFRTKGDMISECQDPEFLKNNIEKTMSCSHPDNDWKLRGEKPSHCGYCLPCSIRRAAIEKAYNDDSSSYRIPDFKMSNQARVELNSFKIGILEYNKQENHSFAIQNAGPILKDLVKYCTLYERGMNELKSFLDKYD